MATAEGANITLPPGAATAGARMEVMDRLFGVGVNLDAAGHKIEMANDRARGAGNARGTAPTVADFEREAHEIVTSQYEALGRLLKTWPLHQSS